MLNAKAAPLGALAFVIAGSLGAALSFYWRPGVLSILMTLGVVIALGIFAWGCQRPDDLGLGGTGVIPGLVYGVLYWLSLQAAVMAAAPWYGGPARLDPQLTTGAWMAFAGPLIDQLIFFASAEEIVYRGFLLPQIYLRLQERIPKPLALSGSALLCSVFFAVLHIPHRLKEGIAGQELVFSILLLVIAGCFFCGIYLLTRNLLTVILVHGLSNSPTLLYDAEIPWQHALVLKYGLALVLAIAYTIWLRRHGRGRTSASAGTGLGAQC